LSFLIPFLYIGIGFFISKFFKDSSKIFSSALVNIFIPIVVFLTITSYKDSIINIVLFSYLFSVIMYFLSLKLYNNTIYHVSFAYFNIGWLGLPVSIYIFGDSVTPIIIAAYIGGMFFGSTFVIWLFQKDNSTKLVSLKKLLTAPPFIAFVVALLFKTFYGTINLNGNLYYFYTISKFIMSFLGMALLGIWLQRHPIKKEEIKDIIIFSIMRLGIGSILFLILFNLFYALGFIDIKVLKYLLIIPFLPVAANVVVLENYYLKSAQSSSIIAVNTIFSIVFLLVFGMVIKLFES